METNEIPTTSPINRHSIISLVLGILTVLTFCGGFIIPIPFTSLVCAPASLVTGILALIYGIISLNKIRKHNETGRPMAWIGIVSAGFIFLCTLCLLVLLIAGAKIAPDSFMNFF